MSSNDKPPLKNLIYLNLPELLSEKLPGYLHFHLFIRQIYLFRIKGARQNVKNSAQSPTSLDFVT